jgi:hypothetical protein
MATPAVTRSGLLQVVPAEGGSGDVVGPEELDIDAGEGEAG